MPIYEYGCEAGHRFEVKQKVSDPPLTKCQVCALPVSKLISAPAISFKGAGWYITDYSNKLKPPAQEGKSENTATSSPTGSTGTDSTPTKTPPGSSGS
jgi:putative FmdB family regulatory protein